MNEEIKNYISSINLDEICRTCLSESDELISIFAEIDCSELDEDISFVYQIFTNVTAIKVLADDGKPSFVCRNCMENANNALRFKYQCERSESLLNTYTTEYRLNNEADTETEQEKTQRNDEEQNEILVKSLNDDATYIKNENQEEEKPPLEVIETSKTTPCKEKILVRQDVESEVKTNVETSNSDSGKNGKIQLSAENIRFRERIALKKLRDAYNKPKQTILYGYTRNENGEKVYSCKFCEKQYKHATSLTVHLRNHTFDRPYLCTSCGKDFKQAASLNYHMRSHTGEQPYACKLCDKKYRQSASLTAHMRVHTGQRPFLCSVCGKGFRQAPDLSYHMRTHTNEKPYMCNVCGKRMSMQCHLVQHLRTHTGEKPFTCKDCGKAFPSSTRLKRHEFIHTGLKPFVCDICKKAFNRSSTLRVHAMIHTDQRPHKCQVCGKGFIQAHCLRSHLKTHF